MPIKDTECDVSYKVLIVGDSGVGKSAILNRLMGKELEERSRPTVGVDFVRKILEADGALIELRIWDTAGLESFRSVTRKQFNGVQGVILVYDVTNKTSFDSLNYWLSVLPHVSPLSPSTRYSYEPIPFLVLANKTDLVDRKKVGIMEGMKLANKAMAFGFHETSAKTGRNVFTAFHTLAFIITDINNPRLMKSYHPHLIRPRGIRDDVITKASPSPGSLNLSQSRISSSSCRKSLPFSSSSRKSSRLSLPVSFIKPKKKYKNRNQELFKGRNGRYDLAKYGNTSGDNYYDWGQNVLSCSLDNVHFCQDSVVSCKNGKDGKRVSKLASSSGQKNKSKSLMCACFGKRKTRVSRDE